jgi:ferric-dicitrate binding protein FerR (iron transport regulator)
MSETSPPQAVKVKPAPFKVDFTKEVRTEFYTSWKDNRWVIEGEPLETLVPVLERRYNLKFRFADEEVKAYKFSGTIQNETIEQILEALTMTAPVKYHIKRDSVLLEIDLISREQYTRLTNKNQEGGKRY